ncbi:unnamed protein product [Mytilus edulis]|uniref:Endonuclease/exonuclease/phosphatase domain-containing protein n=1 Tax=Mytilus edulis TaxID=6550 RepID=A0A8S3U9M8_MYTED|nr:unnamed protein product [Mytilus edulis]
MNAKKIFRYQSAKITTLRDKTIKGAIEFLETGKLKADNIAYQVGSNDLDEKSAEEVVNDMKKLLSSKGNILIIGDLNARVSNHLDFISDENNIHDDLLNLLPDDYLGDSHIYRNSLDKVLNPHGKQLIDLCIASRLRILNGRFVGDLLIGVKYRWENTSRDKMIEVLVENFLKQQIRDFEDSQFEQNFSGIDKAPSDIKIFLRA